MEDPVALAKAVVAGFAQEVANDGGGSLKTIGWTLSWLPDMPGWETDGGRPEYGLPRHVAEELAAAWNADAICQAPPETGGDAVVDLRISTRALNALLYNGIMTIAELIRLSFKERSGLRHLGRKSG